jgi:hypothetical protein
MKLHVNSLKPKDNYIRKRNTISKMSKKDIRFLSAVRTGRNLVKVQRLRAKFRNELNEVKLLQYQDMIENACSSFDEDTNLSEGVSFTHLSKDRGGLLPGFNSLAHLRATLRKLVKLEETKRSLHQLSKGEGSSGEGDSQFNAEVDQKKMMYQKKRRYLL